MSSSTGIPQEPVTALAHRKDMANPPVVAVSALSSSSRCSASHSSAPTLNSQTLAWDQTFLRITYLVSTMTGPATPSQQPSPTTSNPENQHTLPDRRGNGLEGFQDWPDHPALADPAEPKHEKTGWAILSKDKVMRKITQVSKWRDEVVAHADFAYCACSSMPLPTNYGAPVQNRYAPYFDEQSAAPSISPDGICSHCSHPAAPIEPVKQEWQDSTHQKLKSAMNNFKNRLIGRVPTKRKGPSSSQGTVKDLQTTSGIPIGLKQPKEQDSSAHISRSCPAFPRTGMYHISAPPRGPGLKDDLDISSNDAEDDVRSGASSSDSNNHGLFATNARLKRAQHLLARQKPPSPRQQCDDIQRDWPAFVAAGSHNTKQTGLADVLSGLSGSTGREKPPEHQHLTLPSLKRGQGPIDVPKGELLSLDSDMCPATPIDSWLDMVPEEMFESLRKILAEQNATPDTLMQQVKRPRRATTKRQGGRH